MSGQARIIMNVLPGLAAAVKAANRADAAAGRAEGYAELAQQIADAIAGDVGAGVMLAGTYDPQGIQEDAFDRANHTGTQDISTITGTEIFVQTDTDAFLRPANDLSDVDDPATALSNIGGVGLPLVNERISVLTCSRVSVLDYGADSTGVSFSTTAFQNAAAAAVSQNADFIIPEGLFKTNATTTINLTGKAFNDRGRINVHGAGKGRTEWQYTGASGTSALHMLGPAWTSSAESRQTVSGFRLRGMNPAPATGRTGIGVTRAIGLHFDDLEVLECTFGCYSVDVVHWDLTDCGFSFNNAGFATARSPSFGVSNDGSPVNILTFHKCNFIANRQQAATFQDSANIVFLGGSFEGNGVTGAWTSDATRWGVRILDGGYNGAWNLTMQGTHFESSGGTADVMIDHSDHPRGYLFDGCDFVRNGTAQFPTNNIRFASTGATLSRLVVNSGFRSVGGYVPNAGRPYVTHAGTLGLHTFDDEGSVYESSTERPVFAGRNHGYASHAHAFVYFLTAGTINRSNNIASVAKNSTGNYTVTMTRSCRSASYLVVPGMVAGPQKPEIVSRAAGSFVVQFYDAAHAAADPTAEAGFAVFDA